MTPHRRVARAPAPAPAPPQPVLRFCAVCHVSIADEEIESGAARRTRAGHLWCGECVASTPDERLRRREAIEVEFADDAPVLVARPVASRGAAAEPPPLPLPTPAAHATARTAPARPPMSAGEVDVVFLDRRVGELERAAFRLQARLQTVEERLNELERRGGS